jgi:hypothetical protein
LNFQYFGWKPQMSTFKIAPSSTFRKTSKIARVAKKQRRRTKPHSKLFVEIRISDERNSRETRLTGSPAYAPRTFRSLMVTQNLLSILDRETNQLFVRIQGNETFLCDLEAAISWIDQYNLIEDREAEYDEATAALSVLMPSAQFTESELKVIARNSELHTELHDRIGPTVPAVYTFAGLYRLPPLSRPLEDEVAKFLAPVKRYLRRQGPIDATQEELVCRAHLAVLILSADFVSLFTSLLVCQ